MKTENLKVWTTDLRTTDANQAKGKLAIGHIDDQGRLDADFCCLGRGCMAMGLKPNVAHYSEVIQFGRAVSLPPAEFHVWLGLYETEAEALPALQGPGGGRTEFEVMIDWTDNSGEVIEFRDEGLAADCGASGLNDAWDLTFDQIADVLDWFGIRR